ncbi:phosphatase PAP2 family protein [Glycomyces albidus]|uniref:Phosphatase PAP2 family protein n=1 Tax=Glycomyces albidus TaxID=2656774 RepID=A0A6L5GEU8_9ACTN|nr:phosphatase PAP2 family protein [Glycomyces albidus]MQM28101.1 phosphatase PAP2 family protein [Glycomyces albidus]
MEDQQLTLGRRRLLIGSAALAGLMAAPAAGEAAAAAPSSTDPVASGVVASRTGGARYEWSGAAFVDDYTTNTTANLTPETNAAVRILSGFQELWETGDAWNTGAPADTGALKSNLEYCAEVTGNRTEADAKQAFVFDRQHQSHSVIAGLGPLAALYKTGAKAVTAVTGAPDGVPAGTISDAVPPGAPDGAATGPGSTASDLGKVAELVNALRGPHASSNPSKLAFQYPRPWRMNEDSEVVPTGGIPVLGLPAYDTDVAVSPQLLRQRSASPADDGGFPSGHANAAYLAAIAYAYAVPERFQEMLVRASDVAQSRITAGMHSPVDVMGGRILATALAAAVLYDDAYAELRAAARDQARAYFTARTGADDLFAWAHREGADTDPYADRAAGKAAWTERLTYVLDRDDDADAEMTVPKGAEAILETRLPYLDADQRREVLRTTALPAGYALMEGPEQWGRLDLFAAADGYGRFDDDVTVTMDASEGGFSASDVWRGDIGGPGSLTKAGTGSLALAGDNGFEGGVVVQDGVLRVLSATGLGAGDVAAEGGVLELDPAAGRVKLERGLRLAGAALRITVGDSGSAVLKVAKTLDLEPGAALEIALDVQHPPVAGESLTVIEAKRIDGEFAAMTLDLDGFTAVPEYTSKKLKIRIEAA